MAVEDFTTYTEVDPEEVITITSSRCTVSNASHSADDNYAYRNDLDDFGDFQHEFTTYFGEWSSETAQAWWGVGIDTDCKLRVITGAGEGS